MTTDDNPFRVEDLTHERAEEWDAFVERFPGSTVYHLSAWSRILEESFRFRQRGLILTRDGRIVAGLPLFEVPGFTGRRLVSSPFRDRGGVLASNGAEAKTLLAAIRERARRDSFREVVVKQGNELDANIVQQFGLREHGRWFTTLLDLRPGTNRLWDMLGNNAQGPVKQAERLGVEVETTRTAADVGDFAQIFMRTRRRLGIPTFAPDFFQRLMERLAPIGKARLFLARTAGKPVAGVLLLTHNDTASDGYAASMPGEEKSRANDLLVWRVIGWAADNGFAHFDFGADSPLQEGLLAFKRKWGGLHCPVSHYLVPCNGFADGKPVDSAAGFYRLARFAMRMLPVPVYRAASRAMVCRLG